MPRGTLNSLAWLMTPSPEQDAYFRFIEALPERRLIKDLKDSWHVRMLEAAVRENSPEAFRDLLERWLIKIGIDVPSGVFIPLRGSPGRPREKKTEETFRAWIEMGQPNLGHLAYTLFGSDYTQAGAKERKKMCERCRQAIKRHKRQMEQRNP